MIIEARDVYGRPLPRPCEIWAERLGSSTAHRRVARDVPPTGRASFATAATASYRIRVMCEGHVTASKIVGGSTDEVQIAVPIEPSAVVGFIWPENPGPFPGVEFQRLPEENRGALLNIWAKLWATYFGVMPAGAFVEHVDEVRADRIIAQVSPAMAEAIDTAAAAGEVDTVSSAVGHEPPAGYRNGPSIKTLDAFGSLQVSLFIPEMEGAALLADIDVDEERSFVHAFRAIGHHLTGDKTSAVEVQQILEAQGIDTGWRPLAA